LTEEDKKDSSEGKEVFGLTRTTSRTFLYPKGGKLDKKNEPILPVPSGFYLVEVAENNRLEIKMGFEKKFFFNRLGHEE